jgi:hypothetical protein
MVFAAEFATIGWVSASMFATSQCWHTSSVASGSVPHDLVALAESPQCRPPHGHAAKRLLASIRAGATSKHAAGTDEFTRQVLLGYSGLQDEQDTR